MSNKYLEKIAYNLDKHQSRAVKRLRENKGLIAAHSMGSGKTLTALSAIEDLKKKKNNINVIMIVPASLVSNVWKEIDKHDMDITKDDLKVISYRKATTQAEDLSSRRWDLAILDESHGIRNLDTQKSKSVQDILKNADEKLLLSGTPSYNKPEDLGIQLRLASGDESIPVGQEFRNRYIKDEKVEPGFFKSLVGVKPGNRQELKNKRELKELLIKNMDYHDATKEDRENFPDTEEEKVKVEMSPKQKEVYRFLEGKVPLRTRLKIRSGLPPSKQESKALNAYLQGVRQASNSIAPYAKEKDRKKEEIRYSPKMREAVKRQKQQADQDKNFRSVVYSNYLESGQNPMKELLEREGLRTEKFHGGLSKKQKQDIVKKYNEGKIDSLLLSSSGAEGIDLKGTKLMQVMEPHFNKSKIDQAVARGSRFKSHKHLPHNEQKMKVEHYQSTLPRGFARKITGRSGDKAVDEYLYDISKNKDALNEKIIELIS